MTDTRSDPTFDSQARTRLGPRPGVAAPGVTRVAAGAIMAGVLIQAALAGGFLAGYSGLTDIHMMVGGALLVAAIVLVAAGLAGRRTGREPGALLATRVGVLLVLLATAGAGLAAGGGTRDLLIIHIPLAIISMGLSARLLDASRRPRPLPPLPLSTTDRDGNA